MTAGSPMSTNQPQPAHGMIRSLRSVILLRHGQHNDAAPNQLGGLTALGKQQASATAERLRGESIDRIVTSEFRRARQTAEEVAQHHPAVTLETDADICECVPSVPPGQEVFYPEGVQASQTAECREHLDRAYSRYFESDNEGTTLLVCHGNVIRYLLCRVLAVRLDAWARFDIHNCGICRVSSKTYLGTQVTGLNDVGHLPAELLTYG